MNKKLIAIFSVCIMLCTAVFGLTACTKEQEEVTIEPPAKEVFRFTLINNNTEYKLSDYTGNKTQVDIPETYNNLPVTTIGEYVFSFCTTLTSVTMGKSVTTIGSNAFEGCASLTSITIPDSVTTIGAEAFVGCDSLNYNQKDGLKYIGNDNNKYFYLAGVVSNDIISASIDDNCKVIGGYAFSNCTTLTSVTIGNSVTTIGDGAFEGCALLSSITIPDSVMTIGSNAFKGCKYTTSENLNYIGNEQNPYLVLVGAIDKTLSTYNINPNTKYISNAFEACFSLTSITIPNGVIAIGKMAFQDCELLEGITIPDSVKAIGNYAFAYCTSLKSMATGNGVTIIGKYAFDGCFVLTDITLGDSLTTIDESAFAWCERLKTITIPDSVKTIGKYVFYFCYSLNSVVLGNGVTTIDYAGFHACYSLRKVYYKGTIEDFNNISIDWYNTYLTNYMNYYVEDESDLPNDKGKYWHFIDGVPTAWTINN